MKRLYIFSSLLVALLLLSACTQSIRSGQVVPLTAVTLEAPPLDPNLIALGESIYAENCASCHGANLEGEADWKEQNEDGSFKPPPHNADGHTWHHPDSLLLEAIELGGARFEGVDIGGTSDMPGFWRKFDG